MQMRHKLAALIDDRDGAFRVDRAIYTDPEVFEAEVDCLFEGGWLYACHESQVKTAGDFVTVKLGRQPVVIVRKKDGALAAYVNACAHRGATLALHQRGNVAAFTCRFHGWVYALDGRCIKIKNEESGDYLFDDIRARSGLAPVRVESYRGFVFASLKADVAPLGDYLGATRPWIDLMVDQSPQGLEVLPGSSTYVIRGNWKMQAENGVDGYHVSTVHRVFANTMVNREAKLGLSGMARTEAGRLVGNVPTGGYDFGNGHMAIWAQHTDPTRRPIYQHKDRLEREFSAAKVDWILGRGRNLYLFPNLLLMDNPSTQVRTIQPIAPDRAEVTVRCIAPIGESQAARSARLRKFEDFYLTSGMATSDDIAALEATQTGGLARSAPWNDLSRGMKTVMRGAENADSMSIGCEPQTSAPNWDHDTFYHGFYRAIRDRLLAAG